MIQMSETSQSIFVIFLIVILGYLLGAVSVKRIALRTSAVFIVALFVGGISEKYKNSIFDVEIPIIVQNLGLVLFITSVGIMAGKNFFSSIKKYFVSYVLTGAVCVLSSSLVCIILINCTGIETSLAVGLLSGALTSTPGYSAAQEVYSGTELLLKNVAVGHAIAYPFGVLAVVVFVQLIPRILHADIEYEKNKLILSQDEKRIEHFGKKIEPFGILNFSFCIVFGIVLGNINIPMKDGVVFSLGMTGGPLIVALLVGGIKSINGIIDVRCNEKFLEVVREIGLILFLISAGYDGGSAFVEVAKKYGFILIIYGGVMTIIPLLLAYFFSKYVLKMALLNNLGAITGGMTSTPALGALVNVAGTSDVSSAYASTYPIALILVVLSCQIIALFF